MNDDRDEVIASVRRALGARTDRKARPVFDPKLVVSRHVGAAVDPATLFVRQMERVHGRVMRSPKALTSFLLEQRALAGYMDPALMPLLGSAFPSPFVVHTAFDRTLVDSYAFGITRALGAIAETGSLVFADSTTSRRLAAIAPWIHVAVVFESELFVHLPAALAALPDDPNVVFCTGPSKTADVEGILIEGVHGPGEQIALLLS